MVDYLTKLFSGEGFVPRWSCGHWSGFHGWLDIVAGTAIFAAYMVIPGVLAYFFWRRKDVPFTLAGKLFCAFILFCGLTHALDTGIFWWPGYRLLTAMKVATAVVSWAAVVFLLHKMPVLLGMRSSEHMQREIDNRVKAEEALRAANDDLRKQVTFRSALEEELVIMRNLATARNQQEIARAVSRLDNICSELRNLMTAHFRGASDPPPPPEGQSE